MQEWVEHLQEIDESVGGIYGEGEPVSVNTYNGEDLLSQTIQYIYFSNHSNTYVILQIHGGCDVRGGYTAPKVFHTGADDFEGLGIFENARASIHCQGVEKNPNQTEIPGCEKPECGAYWYTDDACHWYADGCTGAGAGTELQDYPVTKEDDDETWEQGSVHVDENGDMYCPHCGGKLAASFY